MGVQLCSDLFRTEIFITPMRESLALYVVGESKKISMGLPPAIFVVVVPKFTVEQREARSDYVGHNVLADPVLTSELEKGVKFWIEVYLELKSMFARSLHMKLPILKIVVWTQRQQLKNGRTELNHVPERKSTPFFYGHQLVVPDPMDAVLAFAES